MIAARAVEVYLLSLVAGNKMNLNKAIYVFFFLVVFLFSAGANAQCGFNSVNDWVCAGGGGNPSGKSRAATPPAAPFAPAPPIANNPSAGMAYQARLKALQQQQEQLAAEREATEAQLREDAARADAAWGAGGSGPSPQCNTDWENVASDNLGWYSNGLGNGKAKGRFSVGKAPDGSTAVQHTIKKGDEIWPLGHDSPVFRPQPGYRAVSLTYQMYIEDGKARSHPGKYMSVMGGRGQAGGAYQNKAGTGPEGWSHYLNSPVVKGTKGTTSAKNGLRGVIGSANRSELGAPCDSAPPRPGADPIGGDKRRCFEALYGTTPATETGRWITIEIVTVMNDKGVANGEAYFIVDGQKSPSVNNVMWAMDPEASPELWVRWRMMFGGNPDSLPPPQDMKEWYRGFSLNICY